MVNLFSISALVLIATSVILAIIIFKYGKDRAARVWGFYNISVIVWGVGAFLIGIAGGEQQAIFAWRLGFVGAIFIAITYLHLTACFHHLSPVIIRFAYIQGVIFALIDIFGKDYYIRDVYSTFGIFYLKANTFFLITSLLIWAFLVALGFYQIIRAYVKSTGLKRVQTMYLLTGMTVGWIGGLSYACAFFHIPIYPLGNFTIPIYSMLVTYGIIKYRLLDIRVTLTRAGISLLVYSALLGIPFYLGYKSESWLISTTAAILFSLPAPFIYRYFSVKAENLLLAQQRHYQKILLQAASGMVREHNLNKLLKLIVYIIKKSVKIKFAAVYFYDRDNRTYILSAKRTSVYAPFNATIDDDSPLIHYIRRYRVPFLSEEIPHKLRRAFIQAMGTDFSLIVPSIIKDGIQAFLVLGAKLDKSPYTLDDINVFNILSHQGALAIENCVFFEEFRTVQQELFQAEKLASIGGLADGVAHQIKNRLNHFSLASGELKLAIQDFLKKNPRLAEDQQCKEIFEYLSKIASSIIDNVKRTDDIVKGILNFTRTTEKDTFFGYFSLHAMVETIVSLLLIKHEKEHMPIHILPDSIETIWGVKSQLNEVVYNLLDNAFEATEEMENVLSEEEKKEYVPEITIKAEDINEHYRITIIDNGIGIKEEDKPKVFAPFFTTKSSYKSGSGIGMYVARRIVEENHNGTIVLESQHTEGVKVTIEIPKPQKK